MNLNPGTKIGRYEIQSLLGTGGMGKVYRAFDLQLEREVALKFLKHTEDEEKLRRFRQEAKAVSALNHPGILTIHEVGEYNDAQYIVSELVEGENLRSATAGKNLPVNEILDIGIQIGNALAAAHRVGIVHRDIKPENVMILPDGYIKVLDFGLAKFVETEKGSAPDLDGSTASLIQTKAGMIIGTVNYMSPEQLRGKLVDERADIWSLGVVLFEMLTRRRPFTGETVSDVIAAVLEHQLPSVSQFNPDLSPEIEKTISRSLEKNKENRFKNAKEFVAALKNIKNFSETGNSAAAAGGNQVSASFHSRKTIVTDANRTGIANTNNLSGVFVAGKHVRWSVVIFSGLLLGSLIGVFGWFYLNKSPLIKQAPIKQMKSERFTTTGNITNGAISPDGRFVAYVQDAEGMQSLWLRQVEETAANQLIAPIAESYSGLTFSPNGDWIYYTAFSNGVGKLRRVTLLGKSPPQEVAKDIDSTIAFAPDGENFAFIRSNPKEGINQIVISNINGGDRILSEKKRPEFYSISNREGLSWSPDGKFIASPYGKSDANGEFMTVAEINAETGEQKFITESKWSRVGRVLWTKNASELLITAADVGSELYQIRKISRSDGQTQNVTGELRDYFNISLNQDSTRLLAVVYDKVSRLYTASSDQPNRTNPLAGGGFDGIGGAAWTADGRIVYVSTESRNRDVWLKDENGGSPQQLTFDKSADEYPAVSDDGKYFVFVSLRSGVPYIWRMNQSGGEVKQLTDKGGENSPIVTPDGKFVVFSRYENRPLLWKVSIEGGEPVQLTKQQTSGAAISRDGKFIVCLTRGNELESATELALVSAATGEIVKTFKPSGILSMPNFPSIVRWLPDNQTFAYVAGRNGISNVWTQTISGGEPKKITDFASDKIFSFDVSKDGKKFVYARGSLSDDLILIENF